MKTPFLYKNLCLITTLSLLLLCLSILSSFHYFSPYILTSKLANISLIIPPLIEPNQPEPEETPHSQKDPCSGRRIYIHALPSKFNQDLLTNCTTLHEKVNFCPYVTNNGFGVQLNNSPSGGGRRRSWYGTHQFIGSVIFHTRMKQYECLTNQPTSANAIYVPFYPGLEVRRFLGGSFSETIRDAMAEELVTWLRERPEWGPMQGWDHFLVSGRTAWDLMRLSYPPGPMANWGNKLLNLGEVKNMTVLTVERSSFSKNEFGVPYPTYFHPSSDSEVVEWQNRVRRAKRRYRFAFGGAPRPNMKDSIRGELITQCSNSEKCKLLGCVNKEDCTSPVYIIETFMEAEFCLQPPGDSLTRRSTFDSILAGCIPVFFHRGSAYVQYLWHLPKDYRKYSVFVPSEGVKNGSVIVEEVLSGVPEEEVRAMREEVIGLIPRIIYAKNKLERIEDAFDISIKNVLERIEGTRRLIQQGKDPKNSG